MLAAETAVFNKYGREKLQLYACVDQLVWSERQVVKPALMISRLYMKLFFNDKGMISAGGELAVRLSWRYILQQKSEKY